MGSSQEVLTGISTHSLTRRLTLVNYYHERTCEYFNSQPHEEADLFFLWLLGN